MNKKDFIFSLPELRDYLKEKKWNMDRIFLSSIVETSDKFSLQIPKYYVDLINWYDPDDPLRKMVIMNDLENNIKEYEIKDPLKDKSYSPVPGIIHKYPDRCLLMLTNNCAVHCRFCFRKNLLVVNSANYEKSMKYIENNSNLWEVILSGGDPFMLSLNFLKKTIIRLKKISHIKIIRFHTRAPVVYPKLITDEFVNVIKLARPFIVVFHLNHPQEITKAFEKAVKKLKDADAILLSQTVLLKDVNNNYEILEDLFRKMIENGIKPYYLHHLDLTAGTDYFRVSIKEGKLLIKRLRENLSGVCLPEYVVDTVDRQGKIPVCWFSQKSKDTYEIISSQEKAIRYIDVKTD